MRYGHLVFAGALAVVMASVPVSAQRGQRPAGQPPAAAAPTAAVPAGAVANYTIPKSTYVAPNTPWGDPDLQGVYDYQSMIPMQRPRELAGKATFTDTELREWAKTHTPNQDSCGVGTRANETCT